MSKDDAEKKQKKEAMKKLRVARKQWIAGASAKIRTHKKAIKLIKEQLEKEAATIPELAQTTGMPSDQVLWYMATLKKYGEIVEGNKDGSYFKYALSEETLDNAQ